MIIVKKIYHEIINFAKRMYYDKQVSKSVSKQKNMGLDKR